MTGGSGAKGTVAPVVRSRTSPAARSTSSSSHCSIALVSQISDRQPHVDRVAKEDAREGLGQHRPARRRA